MTVAREQPAPHQHEAGFVVAEWAIGVVVLVVPVLLLLAVLPSWAAQREAAGAAAREAARIAAAWPEEGPAVAVEGARALLAGRGVDATDAQIAVTMPPGDQRAGTVTAAVRLAGRSTTVPLFGVVTGPAASAVHVHPLDPHRSRP